MYQNILIATDRSELAAKAVEHGVRLAKEIGAKDGDFVAAVGGERRHYVILPFLWNCTIPGSRAWGAHGARSQGASFPLKRYGNLSRCAPEDARKRQSHRLISPA